MVMEAPIWVLEEINSWLRAFFWKGKEQVSGGHCQVAWNSICRPTQFGGLGVKNLQLHALALRVRWEWLRRTDPGRPWQGITMSDDQSARQVFDSLVLIKVGVGSRVLFWRDRWIHGFAIFDIAPLIHSSVDTRTRNRRTVLEALTNNRWLQDIHGNVSFTAQLQLMHLVHVIGSVQRDVQTPDAFSWPCDKSGVYTARSTYQRLCTGLERVPFAKCIWRSWAPLRTKTISSTF
ncbi:Serine/threonine-protein kinase CTR1 [Hordeum vulgare]|nr:Serine/threonine-protein kinase CTR1 [Hordeum vulgare]